jgi:L,D-peptidoglycan transpeptidase YkuD (ErfK/YbiS/YcfS/YnhG family)
MKIWRVKKFNNQYSIEIGKKSIPCQVGKNGLISQKFKREGDCCTPIGKWKLQSLYYREDKCNFLNDSIMKKIITYKITKSCGWCDDINSSSYNQKITIDNDINIAQPHHEKLWREDDAYDIFFNLSYNNNPIIKKMGSAIFLHCSFDNSRPTSGCVAIKKDFFSHALKDLDHETYIGIG